MHGRHGKVTSINEKYGDGSHAEITVTHGRRKRGKSTEGEAAPLHDFNQHRSSIVIPKSDAKNYTLGQKVHVGLQPSEGMQGAADMDDDDEIGQNGAVSQAAAVPGKQSGATSVKPSKGKSKIFAAMKGKKK